MRELEELKARAAERRHVTKVKPGDSTLMDDLDRAIAIAEEMGNHEALYIKTELKYREAIKERDKARAAVLALRDVVYSIHSNRQLANEDRQKVLADTESYEQFRWMFLILFLLLRGPCTVYRRLTR